MSEKKFWDGEFGDNYTARNRVDWQARVPYWNRMIQKTGARTVYEVGCNAGFNLTAIQRGNPLVKLFGCDVNALAVDQALLAGFDVAKCSVLDTIARKPLWDLVCSVGVLIHIPPDKITAFMQAIIDNSAGYVLAVEYEADKETMIPYRGENDRLWKRPFGQMYEAMGLKCVDRVPLTKAQGFDDCTSWLLVRQ